MGGWSLSWQLRDKVGSDSEQDILPSQGHLHTPPHSLRRGQCGRANSCPGHIFGMWEEAGAPEKAHAGRTENSTQTWLWLGIHFFFFSHQHYNKQNNVSQGPVVVVSEEAKDSQKTASAGS